MSLPRSLAVFTILASATLSAACRTEPTEDPGLRERVIAIEASALTRFLAHPARLDGTAAGRHATRLLERARSCSLLVAHVDPSTDARPDLVCAADAALAPELAGLVERRRGDADGLLLWPLGEDGRIELRIDVDPGGGVALQGEAIPPRSAGLLSLFVPDSDAPDAPVLRSDAAWIHARLRPQGGIGLARLIKTGSQADRMFALKGRLLEGALLSGTWELAVLPPVPGGEVPLAVGALHHRAAAPISTALDEALDQLEATWPIRRSPRAFTIAGGPKIEGGCFLDLPLLPELAPCWVVTPDAFVIGYRGEAVDAALAAPAVSSAPASRTNDSPAASRLDVRLDRIAASDLSRLGPTPTPHPGELFGRIAVHGQAVGPRRIALSARLDRRTP